MALLHTKCPELWCQEVNFGLHLAANYFSIHIKQHPSAYTGGFWMKHQNIKWPVCALVFHPKSLSSWLMLGASVHLFKKSYEYSSNQSIQSHFISVFALFNKAGKGKESERDSSVKANKLAGKKDQRYIYEKPHSRTNYHTPSSVFTQVIFTLCSSTTEWSRTKSKERNRDF